MAERTEAKEALLEQGTAMEDVTRAQELPGGRTKAKEVLLEQGTALEDVTRTQERPDEMTKAKEVLLKQGTALKDVTRDHELPDKRTKTGDGHQEVTKKVKTLRRIPTKDARQEADTRTKDGECSLAKSKDAMVTPQVPPGLLDATEARLEASLRLAIPGSEKDVEPKDLGEAHCSPLPQDL